jgi:hypothetical protein
MKNQLLKLLQSLFLSCVFLQDYCKDYFEQQVNPFRLEGGLFNLL